MNWINTTIYLALLAGIFYLLYLTIKYRLQRNKLFIIATNINNELFVQSSLVSQFEKEIEQLNLKESDGFVKFISQSRDWAFEYIEEVQKALLEFDEEVAPKFEWAKTYGIVTDGGTHGKVLDEISVAYDKLKSILPENTETPNN